MPPLELRRGATGDLTEDAMELRVAAETCAESGVEQCALASGFALAFIVLEEALHALSVAEVDDGEPGLLLEEPAEP